MSAKASTSKARVFVAPDASAADEEIISPAEQRRIIEASGLLTGVRPSDLRHRTVRAGGHSRLALDDAELEADSAPDETGSEPSEVDWADDGPSDLDNLSPRQAELLASVLWIMPFLVLFSSLCVGSVCSDAERCEGSGCTQAIQHGSVAAIGVRPRTQHPTRPCARHLRCDTVRPTRGSLVAEPPAMHTRD